MRKSVEERSRSISSKNFVVGRHFRSGHPEVANQALTSMKQVHFTHCRSSKYWHFSQISIRFLKISGVTMADLPAILTAAALDSSRARRNGDFQLICIAVHCSTTDSQWKTRPQAGFRSLFWFLLCYFGFFLPEDRVVVVAVILGGWWHDGFFRVSPARWCTVAHLAEKNPGL